MTDLHWLTVSEAAESLRRREISSAELTKAAFDRISALDGELNAFLTLTQEQALAQARAADETIAAGHGGPLTGIPAAVKDVMVTGGGIIPTEDVPRLKKTGIAEVFGPGTTSADIVTFIKKNVKQRT